MKSISEMSVGELAAFVCSYLMMSGIRVVLSGGGCVTIYTKNSYQSYDLDFIENIASSRKKVRELMSEIGFREEGRHFKHPDTEFFIEFPPGPLCIGNEPVRDVVTMELSTGKLQLLSPTDCVKDRLAAYYHWSDRQCLEQAVLVSENNRIDISEVERWSRHEGMEKEFSLIKALLEDAQKKWAKL